MADRDGVVQVPLDFVAGVNCLLEQRVKVFEVDDQFVPVLAGQPVLGHSRSPLVLGRMLSLEPGGASDRDVLISLTD